MNNNTGPITEGWLNMAQYRAEMVQRLCLGGTRGITECELAEDTLRLIPVVRAALAVDKAEVGYSSGELRYPEYTTALDNAVVALHRALQGTGKAESEDDSE